MQRATIYTAKFECGKEITRTSREFRSRLDFYNWICENSILTKKYGRLIKITCRPEW